MPTPILTVGQMRAWEEATWSVGRTPRAIIDRVGVVLAEAVLRQTKSGDAILLLVGKGNNGQDTLAASPHLLDRDVRACEIADPETQFAGLEAQLERRPALIVDGLFGIGLNRRLSAAWVRLIERVNRSAIPILAVDLPSGLNAETGQAEGGCIRAQTTLTVGAPKQGMLKGEGPRACGRIEVAQDVGLVPLGLESELQWGLASDFRSFPPRRPPDTHKGTCGHVVLLAGSRGYHGAAVLAARGALRAQPGLVTLAVPETVYVPIASQLQAAMVHVWDDHFQMPTNCGVLVAGPGLAGPEAAGLFQEAVQRSWRSAACAMIVDASALDWLPPSSEPAGTVRVITPHPGEAARMLQCTTEAVQANRPKALRELSKRFGDCWVVLKGHQTLIGRSSGPIFFNPSGNPHLAQGGAGDVLAGYLGALLAQRALQEDVLQTIRFGVWQHGAAADHLQTMQPNWTISDLLEAVGGVSSR